VCTENSSSRVLVMKSAENGDRFDPSGPLNRTSYRRIFVQRSMRSDVVGKRDLRTRTGPFFARFFIGIIPDLVAELASMSCFHLETGLCYSTTRTITMNVERTCRWTRMPHSRVQFSSTAALPPTLFLADSINQYCRI